MSEEVFGVCVCASSAVLKKRERKSWLGCMVNNVVYGVGDGR